MVEHSGGIQDTSEYDVTSELPFHWNVLDAPMYSQGKITGLVTPHYISQTW